MGAELEAPPKKLQAVIRSIRKSLSASLLRSRARNNSLCLGRGGWRGRREGEKEREISQRTQRNGLGIIVDI